MEKKIFWITIWTLSFFGVPLLVGYFTKPLHHYESVLLMWLLGIAMSILGVTLLSLFGLGILAALDHCNRE